VENLSLENLIETFKKDFDFIKSNKEAFVRQKYIDPFFKLLGWDFNSNDVIPEDRVKISGKPKAPDYCFLINNKRQFFVEAKIVNVNIKEDKDSALQIRRYGYSAKLPLCILTDFEEFVIYDTRIRPYKDDISNIARIFYCTYDEYSEKFDYIQSIFSRDAIINGSLSKWETENKVKKGTDAVDEEFLKEIENWREMLAKNIYLRNGEEKIKVHELNDAVQRLIDRIIFLRIAEDRNIEDYGKLKRIVEGKTTQNNLPFYSHLLAFFKNAKDKYNSDLFDIDNLLPHIIIDDTVLKHIINSTYYPSPYEFSVMPIEIIGSVYERFLGKTIYLTEKRARVTDKPEVRKAGGVYYTPEYIVEYIVKNTLGELIKDKTPEEISQKKILDPACGSGSFLVNAFNYLLEYHLDYYKKSENIKKAIKENRIYEYQAVKNYYKLKIEEKQRILINNIFGVDIDPQAVEVTKLSLLLKLMENETAESVDLLKHSHLKALPRLVNNIKCGNSLIGSDFYETKEVKQRKLNLTDAENKKIFTDEEKREINAFDWDKEFPDIFKNGGFDCVIGNPPYVLGRETFDKNIKSYLSNFYMSYCGKFDLYIYFTEKAIKLLKNGGLFSYILPNTILSNENAIKLRKLILNSTNIQIIKSFNYMVFQKAQVENIIINLKKGLSENNYIIIDIFNQFKIKQSDFNKSNDYRFNIVLDDSTTFLINKIEGKSQYLGNLTDICIGIQLGGSEGNNFKDSYIAKSKIDSSYKMVLDGRDINYYFVNWSGKFVKYGNWLHRKRDEKYFLNPKIIIRQIGVTPIATFDNNNYYTLNTIYNIINISSYSLQFILAIINSNLGKWLWSKKNSDFKSLFPKIKKTQIEMIPIRTMNLTNPVDKKKHDHLVSVVDQMLEVQKKYHTARTDNDKTMYKREIDRIDNDIDQLVYKLYDLTDEEIKIIEEGTKK